MSREADAWRAERVARILAEELPSPTTFGSQALDAAVDLLLAPRQEWALPKGSWEETVVALAIVVLRTEGGLAISRVRAVQAVSAALMEMERKAPA